MIMEIQELHNKCLEWQGILGLHDWLVKPAIVRHTVLGKNQGECRWTLGRKEAWIGVLDPIDYPEDCIVKQDMETTLVHELLHIHFAPFDDFEVGTLEDTATEQAINAIAKALVKLKRGAT